MATTTQPPPPSLASLLPPDDDDRTAIVWSDPSWPYGDLTRSSALRYFELSPFYDPTDCNNADARARGLDPSVEGVLRSFPPGRTEYVVAEAHEAQRLFVIRRQVRRVATSGGVGGGGGGAVGGGGGIGPAGGVARATGYFYILYMSVYQAPTLHLALSARLDRALYLVRGALAATERALAPLPRLLREEKAAEERRRRRRRRRKVVVDGGGTKAKRKRGADDAMEEEDVAGLLMPLPRRGGGGGEGDKAAASPSATAATTTTTGGAGGGAGAADNTTNNNNNSSGDGGGAGTNTADARAAAPLPVSRPPVPAAEQRVWERGDALVLRALGRYGDARRWGGVLEAARGGGGGLGGGGGQGQQGQQR